MLDLLDNREPMVKKAKTTSHPGKKRKLPDETLMKIAEMGRDPNLSNANIALACGVGQDRVSKYLRCEVSSFCSLTGWNQAAYKDRLLAQKAQQRLFRARLPQRSHGKVSKEHKRKLGI